MDDGARLLHQTALAVQYDLANGDHHFALALSYQGSPNRRPDSRGEVADVKGLGDTVIRASIQGIDFVIRTIPNSQHQNRKARGKSAQDAAGLNTSHARHIDVE